MLPYTYCFDNKDFEMEYTSLILIGTAFLLFLSILWLILPFAVFGIKNRLDKLIKQNAELIDLQRR